MSPVRIAVIAIGINVPFIVLLIQLLILKTWRLGDQPYTNLLMFLGLVPLSFGIGLMTVAFEVRKQNQKAKGKST